jgi:Glycosyl transferases group 1
MRLKHFYTWGCFHPMTSGADLVVSNQFAYFRQRGWTIDCVFAKTEKDRHFEAFCDRHPWVNTITPVDIPHANFAFRDLLFAFDHACRAPKLRDALAAPADLLLTNYVFTAPLVQYLPPGCKRVLETLDIMTQQFAFAEREKGGATPADRGSLAAARDSYLFGVELDLYRLFDATIMINRDEHERVTAHGMGHSYYVPQMFSPKPLAGVGGRSHYDYDLIFVGSGAPINARGLTWFYRNVFVPYLWRHGVRMLVIGAVCDALPFGDANVTLLRQVEGTLDPLYDATKLVVNPIFEGTGLSIKTLEGLANGRAMVVTPAGARGLHDAGDAFVCIDMKADAAHTAGVILELLARADKRHALERAAIAYVNRHFSPEAYFTAMDRVVRGIGLDPLASARPVSGMAA